MVSEEVSKLPHDLESIFWSRNTYKYVSEEFHIFHKNSANVLFHLLIVAFGEWGVVQLLATLGCQEIIYVYGLLIFLTTPLVTAGLHSVFVFLCLKIPITALTLQVGRTLEINATLTATLVIGTSYILHNSSHYFCVEKTYMQSYIDRKPWMVVLHTIWEMPLVIDAVLMKNCFLSALLVNRSRIFATRIANQSAVDDLRNWIATAVKKSRPVSLAFPRKEKGPPGLRGLEKDAAIVTAFRNTFNPKNFDFRAVPYLHELHLAGDAGCLTSLAHIDGPFRYLPFVSIYRVCIGISDKQKTSVQFPLEHKSQNKDLGLYDAVGYDFNREVHSISDGSFVSLYYVVYPKGWRKYRDVCVFLVNSKRKAMSKTTLFQMSFIAMPLRLLSVLNAHWEKYIGWSNSVYVAAAYFLFGPTEFMVLTAFRHYAMYIATLAWREPTVAQGAFIRDARLFKLMSNIQIGICLYPYVVLSEDMVGLGIAALGGLVAFAATLRLGTERTYFGAELGFVPAKWIEGFPYGTIPHPMIMGQVFALGSILWWFWDKLSADDALFFLAHSVLYLVHCTQEILVSSY